MKNLMFILLLVPMFAIKSQFVVHGRTVRTPATGRPEFIGIAPTGDPLEKGVVVQPGSGRPMFIP